MSFFFNLKFCRITAFLDTWPKLEKWYKHFGILQWVDATEDENTLFLEVEKILEETLAKVKYSFILDYIIRTLIMLVLLCSNYT